MTLYDQCLAKAEEIQQSLENQEFDNNLVIFNYQPALRALKVAIERHGPDLDHDVYPPTGDPYCLGCHAKLFPCQELTEIAKELGI